MSMETDVSSCPRCQKQSQALAGVEEATRIRTLVALELSCESSELERAHILCSMSETLKGIAERASREMHRGRSLHITHHSLMVAAAEFRAFVYFMGSMGEREADDGQ